MSELKYEKVSADEVQAKRQEIMGENGSLVKAGPLLDMQTKGTSWDKEARSARFVMSAEAADRMGDIVVQEGLATENFMKNPQALLFHNSRDFPIGSWKDIEKNLTGRPKRTEGTMKLLDEGVEPSADRAARHIAAGTMKTVSIGFSVKWDSVEAIKDENNRWLGYRFNESELLECSLVPIPAMQLALMKEVTPNVLAIEHRELIEMTLDTFARDPVTKQIIRREDLEKMHREATGEKTFVMLSQEGLDAISKMVSDQIAVIRSAGDPLKPQDGEEVDRQPDPEDDAKKKEAQPQERSIDEAVREHARQSKEPGLWVKFMRSIGMGAEENRQEPEVVQEKDGNPVQEVTAMSDADKTALEMRVKGILQNASSLTGNAGAAG